MMKKAISIVLMLTLLVSSLTVPAFAAMKKGSRGSDVTWHQKTMNFLGYSCGSADGIYGSKTVTATKQFQKDYGLTRDGIAGTKTVSREKALVREIQQMLTDLGCGKLLADGLPGTKTIQALKQFQKRIGAKQTGVCDSKTLRTLRAEHAAMADSDDPIAAFEEKCLDTWTLPLKATFKSITGSRAFASSRSSGTRAHAGIDFVAAAGTKVYAMTSGKVLQVYAFYESTYAVEVLNDDGSILRYCEISSSVEAGDRVKQGEVIGKIKRATGGTEMLHLELYYGDASGALTQRNNTDYTYVDSSRKFQRRADLLDPTFLKNLPAPR